MTEFTGSGNRIEVAILGATRRTTTFSSSDDRARITGSTRVGSESVIGLGVGSCVLEVRCCAWARVTPNRSAKAHGIRFNIVISLLRVLTRRGIAALSAARKHTPQTTSSSDLWPKSAVRRQRRRPWRAASLHETGSPVPPGKQRRRVYFRGYRKDG